MDIGQPKDFIIGTDLYLSHIKHAKPDLLVSGDNFRGPVFMVRLISVHIYSLLLYYSQSDCLKLIT